jgi:hypothetical protein
MKQIFYSCSLIIFLLACNDTGPYLKHDLTITSLGKDCAARSEKIGMNSNTIGERYEFEECLPAGFTKDKLLVERRGDSVLVQFPKPEQQQELFRLVLDINTYPQYHFITIGDQTLHIIPSN